MAAALTPATARQAFVRSAVRECMRLRADPWDLAMATWIPLLALALFAWMFGAGVPRALPVAVVDHDNSVMSRELVRMIDAAPGLQVAARPADMQQAWAAVRAAEVYAVVHVPEGSGREILRGGSAVVFAYYNASHQTAGQAAERGIGDAVQAAGERFVRADVARIRGPDAVRAPPLRVQATVLANAARSYEQFLLGLLFPALLYLAACLAMVSALGRELRDGTAGEWLQSCGDRLLPAVAGKLAPYLLLFTVHGTGSLVWLAAIRGGVAGSAALLLAAQAGLYLASAGIALLLVGATRNLGVALSVTGLYAGTALAFSGATFPMQGAPLFAQAWSRLLPLTPYLKLQVQQLELGADWTASLPTVGGLLLFMLVAGGIGLVLYGRGARDPAAWGQR
ncbi:MAG: ABC transporter permease [Gammaproteobacteria bacterium]|nr:ABC transporter permease [Gammaproteobacteria bacterium]